MGGCAGGHEGLAAARLACRAEGWSGPAGCWLRRCASLSPVDAACSGG